MRILLVGNYPLDYQPSMSRYAELLRREMQQRGHTVELLTPMPIVGRLYRGHSLGKWLGYVDKYLLFPWVLLCTAWRFDLVHICDHSNSMYLPYTAGKPKSITCHDLLAVFSAEGRFMQQKISLTGRIQQRWIRKHLMAAPYVVCVSQFTGDHFRELGARKDQVRVVIPNPLNFAYEPAPQAEVERMRVTLGMQPKEQYLLHVGGDPWYKNRIGAVRIYHQLIQQLQARGQQVPRLVLAGRPVSDEIRDYVEENGLRGFVIPRTHPSNEELAVLYTGAKALLFPSLYEGFGWPPLEAQSCGCPVITSNRPPMTEVAGEGAMLIDPADEAGAGRIIADRFDDLEGLRVAGFDNLKRYDLKAVMNRYESFFQAAASARRDETPRIAATPGKVDRNTFVRRLLIYRPGTLTDMMMALPSLHLVARAFPRAERALLTHYGRDGRVSAAEGILEGSDLVESYFCHNVGMSHLRSLFALRREIRRRRPDALVYLGWPRGTRIARRDAIFFRLCGISRLIGVPLTEDMQKHRYRAATGMFESEAARLARCIAELGDARLDDPASWDPCFTAAEERAALIALEPAAKRPIIACSVSTTMQAKDWGDDNWSVLLRKLARQYPGHALLVVGGMMDYARSEDVVEEWKNVAGSGPVINLCGQLQPRETAAALAYAKIFIGHDSAPLHMAEIVQTPVLGIYSARNRQGIWYPQGKQHCVIYHKVDCAGCGLRNCIIQHKKCLASITVDEVLADVKRMLPTNLVLLSA